MVDFCTLSSRIWPILNDATPHAYYYADSDKTVKLQAYDPMMRSILAKDSVDVQVKKGINDINLGSLLSEWLKPELASSLQDGTYIVCLGDYCFSMLFVNGYTGVREDYEQYVKKMVAFDNVLGTQVDLGVEKTYVPIGEIYGAASSRFTVALYLHDDERRLGKLVLYHGVQVDETPWARYAVIDYTVSFDSYEAMWQYVAKYLAVGGMTVAEALGMAANADPEKAATIAAAYQIRVPFGRLVGWRIDPEKKQIVMRIAVRLGWGWDEAIHALRYVLAGAVAGAGLAAAAALTMGSLGAGAVAAGAIAGGAIGLAYSLIANSEDEYAQRIQEVAQRGIQDVNNSIDMAEQSLKALQEAGHIDAYAASVIGKDLEYIRTVAVNAIKEVAEEAKGAYQAGYNKGYNDAKWKYGLLSVATGIGGFVVGNEAARQAATVVVREAGARAVEAVRARLGPRVEELE